MSTAQHDNIFSLMKGFAIISVVIGHCSVASVEGFVNQYHLATFYFIAGYFFNPAYLDVPKTFIVKRIKRLYLPFMSYGLMFLLLHNVFCHLGLYPADGIYTVSDFVHNGLTILCLTSYEPFMGAMWFAPSLLMVSIAYVAARKAWPTTKSGGGDFMFSDWIYMLKNGRKKPVLHLECDGYSSNFPSWQRVERTPMVAMLCW